MTFTFAGFQTIKREGLELPSNFTVTINADLKVGAVAGNGHRLRRVAGRRRAEQREGAVLSREMLDAVPTAHTIQSVGQLVVGVTLTAPDVGGSQAMQQTYFTVHGCGAAQTSVMMDGMIINGLQGDGAIQSYLNDAGNQEMVYQTGGGTVDSPTGGVKINLIPKEGGNRFAGSLFLGYESEFDAERQPVRITGGQRRQDVGQDRHVQRHQRHAGRADREGQDVVFRALSASSPSTSRFRTPFHGRAGQTYANCVQRRHHAARKASTTSRSTAPWAASPGR